MPQFNAKVLCHAVISVKENVDPVEFMLKENDVMAEPRTANGTVIIMKPEKVDILKRDVDKNNITTKENQFMHFSYRGAMFCVDTINKTITSTSKAKVEEMIGHKENGLWPMKVETSN